MSKFGDFIKADDFKSEKHVPVIELPDNVNAGEEFDIKVTVGKEIGHPNLTEHFIGWIELYYNSSNEKAVYNLGRSEFHSHGESIKGANQGPAHTSPTATFSVKLEGAGTLVAVSYCNIHGVWESSKEIAF